MIEEWVNALSGLVAIILSLLIGIEIGMRRAQRRRPR